MAGGRNAFLSYSALWWAFKSVEIHKELLHFSEGSPIAVSDFRVVMLFPIKARRLEPAIA